MKKLVCSFLAGVVVLSGSASLNAAWGDGGGGHGGGGGRGSGGHGGGVPPGTSIIVDPGLWGPGYGPAYPYPPYPYYPPYPPYPYNPAPPAAVPEEPSGYIVESVEPGPRPQPTTYWYYCEDPQGYYPRIRQCPGGWMTVVPPATAPPR